jgi:hypothetical protein
MARTTTGGTPEEPTPEPRDLVASPEGVRPQRSTEEHGSGLDRSAPEHPDEPDQDGQGGVGPPSSGPGTPEGHTPERPSADEYGKVGTPAAGLSPATPHAADAEHGSDAAHGSDAEPRMSGSSHAVSGDRHAISGGGHAISGGGHPASGDGHAASADGHAATDDHAGADAHGETAFGPIDWGAWGYSALGLAIAAVVAALFYVATLPK